MKNANMNIRICKLCRDEYVQEIKWARVCPTCMMDTALYPKPRAQRAARRERITNWMLNLREDGFTNKDISDFAGRSICWAYQYIGKEPKEYWKNAVRTGAKIRKFKNEIKKTARKQRKVYMQDCRIVEQRAVLEQTMINLEQRKKDVETAEKQVEQAQNKLIMLQAARLSA